VKSADETARGILKFWSCHIMEKEDGNYILRQLYQFHKTGMIPYDVRLLCPNHHVLADRGMLNNLRPAAK